MVDAVLGNYRLRMEIGRGGMGAVYVADHLHLARQVAIKVLLPELCVDPNAVKRLFQEARATSLIQHPGIIEIIDCAAPHRDLAFIVMELLTGESLSSYLKRIGPLPQTPAVLDLVCQIAAAVGAAHAQGIFHRDLKPDNVFLLGASSPQRIKVLDFGIAKLTVGAINTSRTRTGALMGTPLYMSPEQCRDSGTVDHRADIYSFGCLLYELCCGRPPFNYEGAGSLLVAHISEPAPDPRTSMPQLPAELAALILACLAKDVSDRPQSMADVEAALRQVPPSPARTLPPLMARNFSAEVPWRGRTGIDELDAQAPTGMAPPPSSGGRPVVSAQTPMQGRVPVQMKTDDRSAPFTPPPGAVRTTTTLQQSASEMVVPTVDSFGGSRSRRPIWATGVVTAVVIAGVVVFGYRAYEQRSLGRSSGERQPAPSSRAEQEPGAGEPAAAAASRAAERSKLASSTVSVEIEGAPPGLVVKVDGAEKAAPVELPKSDRFHLFELAAPGFVSQRLKLDATRSRVVTLAMQPEKRAEVSPELAAAPKDKDKDKSKKARKRDRVNEPSQGSAAPTPAAPESFHRFDDI